MIYVVNLVNEMIDLESGILNIGISNTLTKQFLMPYIKELMARFINWEIATSIIWIVLGVVITIIGITSIKHIWKQKDEYNYFGDPDEGITWLFGASIVLVVIGVLISINQCFDIVEAIYLPEKTIYDFINCQIKCHN
mgnify:CR=1 FL=1